MKTAFVSNSTQGLRTMPVAMKRVKSASRRSMSQDATQYCVCHEFAIFFCAISAMVHYGGEGTGAAVGPGGTLQRWKLRGDIKSGH